MDNPPLHCASLCTGLGGLDLGAGSALEPMGARLRHVLYCEREAYAISLLLQKMEDGQLDAAPVWSDVHTVATIAKDFRGVVDVVCAGFPCQPFSTAGKRQADADERHLWPPIAGFIRAVRPRLVFLENVAGITTARDEGGRPILLNVLQDLERMGYMVECGLFTAGEVGASQLRTRCFIMAHADGHGGKAAKRGHLQPRTAQPVRADVGDIDSRGAQENQGIDAQGRDRPDAVQSDVDNAFRLGHQTPDPQEGIDGQATNERSGAVVQPALHDLDGLGRDAPGRPGPRAGRGVGVPAAWPGFPASRWEWPRPYEPPRFVSKPGLAGSFHGFPHWVDDDAAAEWHHRIYHLGNAVVPEQAALAFTTLAKRLNFKP